MIPLENIHIATEDSVYTRRIEMMARQFAGASRKIGYIT